MKTAKLTEHNNFFYSLVNNPGEYLPALDKALRNIVEQLHDPLRHADLDQQPFYVGLRGSLGDNHVNPRTLRAMYLGKLVCIEGIVTRCKFYREHMYLVSVKQEVNYYF